MRVLAIAISLTIAACGYGASFNDCTISCSSATECPSGFSCSLENLCRSSATAPPCSLVVADAGAHDAIDTMLGDAPIAATLSETTDSVVGTYSQCDPGNAATTDAAQWYRAFQPSDPHFGITDSF